MFGKEQLWVSQDARRVSRLGGRRDCLRCVRGHRAIRAILSQRKGHCEKHRRQEQGDELARPSWPGRAKGSPPLLVQDDGKQLGIFEVKSREKANKRFGYLFSVSTLG